MAIEVDGDILMMVTGSKGPIPAEGQVQIHGTDTLAKDFKPGTYFTCESFGFGVNVQDDDSGGSKGHDTSKTTKKGKFNNWLSNSGNAKTYPVELDEFEFERPMDKASPVLFQACVNRDTLPSAVVIKRRDIGSRAGRDAYLRIEFQEVLITSIDWNSGAYMKEKCKFIARKVLVKYRPQAAQGEMGAVVHGEFAYTFTKTG